MRASSQYAVVAATVRHVHTHMLPMLLWLRHSDQCRTCHCTHLARTWPCFPKVSIIEQEKALLPTIAKKDYENSIHHTSQVIKGAVCTTAQGGDSYSMHHSMGTENVTRSSSWCPRVCQRTTHADPPSPDRQDTSPSCPPASSLVCTDHGTGACMSTELTFHCWPAPRPSADCPDAQQQC